ncbi:hypothetical protein PPYR_06307 [Photinus pyralis]|uniref:CRAL-TRIO domain-containing protein n=1 Tax=Photinus pyralis TaxID=7054 RepID=A0A5N4ATA7_PHOPY|nr:retinol-binding protein pinta-like [Photinus pyralis]KAB0800567.1 hypothetical protein PPYR_06307 [Photinus pyralis]
MAVRNLSAALQEIAERELFETPEKLNDGLVYIRDWLQKQPHLNARTDDQFLTTFLRGCKFSLHRTQEKLDYYYTSKTILTELYSNRDPYDPEIQELLKAGVILPLPNTLTESTPRIILLHLTGMNPDKVSFLQFQKLQLMIYEILLQEDDRIVTAGVDIWTELKNTNHGYATQITPTSLKKFNSVLHRGYPIRMKSVYCTNCPPIAESLFNLMKSILNEKIRNRMGVFSGSDEFYKKLPKKLHPIDFGGENGKLSELQEFWKGKVESYRDWFLEDTQYGTKEELRVGIPKTSATLFGVEGTFRKLAVD